MESERDNPAKRPRMLKTNLCIICSKSLEQKKHIKHPSKPAINRILECCEIRKDKVYDNIWVFKDEILSKKIEISFHEDCRAKYTSKSNLKYVKAAPDLLEPSSTGSAKFTEMPSQKSSREASSTFDIRKDCFICAKFKWNEKLSRISTGTGCSTQKKVLDAARQRGDDIVIMRMIAHEDLFAYDAKYHRGCLSHYISERNIQAAIKKNIGEKSKSVYDEAFQFVVSDIEEKVLSKVKSVTSLSILCDDYNKKLDEFESEIMHKSSSWKLKHRLITHFEHRLSFIERPGKSDIVCDSNLEIGLVLKGASLLEDTEYDIEVDNLASNSARYDEKQLLHNAAGLLRAKMSFTEQSGGYYVSNDKLKVSHCKDFVPDTLYDFVTWCVDNSAYTNVDSCVETGNKDNLKVIALCHGLLAQCRGMYTPITLGLGIRIHHDFGSKQLIEDLAALGYSVSYDEVRRFLTSVAMEQSDQVYIPKGFGKKKGIGTNGAQETEEIDAAIDNFDQNEDTLDGKSTTHSMAAVLYKRCPPSDEQHQIPRLNKKTITPADVGDAEIVHRFKKPNQRPEPEQVTEKTVTAIDRNSACYISAAKKDAIYLLCRYGQSSDQNIPAWTGFNSVLSDKALPVTTIGYLPFIRASPSDPSTIYTVLIKIVDICEKVGQEHILVTADMAIYSKAQEILWSKPERLDGKITMRIGGMHLTMTFLASLGKLYGDGGLKALLTESDVYADATANMMLQGKQFARGLRGIKLVYEALFRVLLDSLHDWLAQQGLSLLNNDLKEKLHEIQQAFSVLNREKANELIAEVEEEFLPEVLHVLEEFKVVGEQSSATFAYWLKFLEGVNVLLHLMRAERDADFNLHLSAVCETLPWFRAAGRHNYAKFVPVYVAEMKALEDKHPQSYYHLQNGGFVVRRSAEHSFNCVATDQALEQTINREGKSQGGVIGLTLRKGALTRWLMTRHITAGYVESFKELCHGNPEQSREHTELGKKRKQKDEADVNKVMKTVLQQQNPFDLDTVPAQLVNIVSGQITTTEVQNSLSTFLTVGEKKHQDFMNKKLIKDTKQVSFWQAESRLKIATFADMKKSVEMKASKLMFDSEVLFRRLLAVSKQRDVDMESVLCHELAGVPPSLFYDDGVMRKTTKADLSKKLESNAEPLQSLSQSDSDTAYLLDGMALLQAVKEETFNTFDDLGRQILSRIMSILKGNLNVTRVVLVFDRYDNPRSIKHSERVRRGAVESASHVINGNHTVPNYRVYMKNPANKAALAAHVSKFIIESAPKELSGVQQIDLAGGFDDPQKVLSVSCNGSSALRHLYSTQEEADTRLVLHSIDLAQTFSRIIIQCDDTDVLVLLIYYTSLGLMDKSDVYMYAGHTTKYTDQHRYIQITPISKKLGKEVCECLPAVHALTGCDTTSSLFKIGKKTAYSKLIQRGKELPGLRTFGLQKQSDIALSTARNFTLLMYGNKKKDTGQVCSSLDELRYVYACTTDKTAAQFPPTEDAFQQHVLRAEFQTAIWKHSHIPKPDLWDPEGNGWKVIDDVLSPVLFLKDAAPIEVRDLTHLYCSDDACTNSQRCQCVQSGLACTEFCSCQGIDCPNVKSTNVSAIDTDEED